MLRVLALHVAVALLTEERPFRSRRGENPKDRYLCTCIFDASGECCELFSWWEGDLSQSVALCARSIRTSGKTPREKSWPRAILSFSDASISRPCASWLEKPKAGGTLYNALPWFGQSVRWLSSCYSCSSVLILCPSHFLLLPGILSFLQLCYSWAFACKFHQILSFSTCIIVISFSTAQLSLAAFT